MKQFLFVLLVFLPFRMWGQSSPIQSISDGTSNIPLTFSGGYETDPRDHGRPVVLIAGALGVSPGTFHGAFSHVHPAGPGSGGPTDEEARANKQMLMTALGPYGVTNDRLNTVSNYYRYRSWAGERWPTRTAVGYALVKRGVIIGFVITNGGSGYSSPPTVTIPTALGVKAMAQLSFNKEFEKNGAVSSVTLVPPKTN